MVALTTASLVTGAVALTYGSPLGRPPDATTGVGTFKFTSHQRGQVARPVAYDPCEPIEIVVNDSSAPDGGGDIFLRALDEVSARTGLRFEVKGQTDERLGSGRRHGGGAWFSPVLVDWTSAKEVPELAGRVAGQAGSTAVGSGVGELRYVTGTVALDAPDLTRILQRPDGDAQVEAIIKHELGHLVGLDHVDDPYELMNDDNLGLSKFGPGDREGLAKLGRGRCLPGL